MATILYRINDSGQVEENRVDGSQVAFRLANGWACTPEELTKTEEPEAPTFDEADINDSGKLSNTEVRAAAKEAGIEDWKTARIKVLKEQLGYES